MSSGILKRSSPLELDRRRKTTARGLHGVGAVYWGDVDMHGFAIIDREPEQLGWAEALNSLVRALHPS